MKEVVLVIVGEDDVDVFDNFSDFSFGSGELYQSSVLESESDDNVSGRTIELNIKDFFVFWGF